jgi:putative membrane protein insertion efficiency factor
MKLPGRLLIGLVHIYRLAVSPVLAPSCRYWPSCSEYAIEALRRHGAARGSWLTARRLCRCHPWSAGGVDEVPASLFPAGSTPSNNRWRAYVGDSRRDHPDLPSS